MGNSHGRSVPNWQTGSDESKDTIPEGQEPDESPSHTSAVSSSGIKMSSGTGRELTADIYAKPTAVLLESNEKVWGDGEGG